MKRITVDLAKSFYPVAERVRCGQMVQRKRLNREAFTRYIQERAEPVEWVVEVYGAGHDWGGWPGKADRKHLPFMAFFWGRWPRNCPFAEPHIPFTACCNRSSELFVFFGVTPSSGGVLVLAPGVLAGCVSAVVSLSALPFATVRGHDRDKKPDQAFCAAYGSR